MMNNWEKKKRRTQEEKRKTNHLVLLIDPMVNNGEEPGGPLQGVGAAGLQVQGAEAPELQLAQEVPGTHSLRQVQLALQHNILIWTAL